MVLDFWVKDKGFEQTDAMIDVGKYFLWFNCLSVLDTVS
jgi:hypothetical protein